MVSGGILKAVLLLEIPMPKKTNKYIKGDNYKKTIRESGSFRENTVRRSSAF